MADRSPFPFPMHRAWSGRAPGTRLALLLAIAAGQGLLVGVGEALGQGTFQASPLWPAAGFALAATYALGYRVLPAILLGELGADLALGLPWDVSLAGSLAALPGPAVGAFLLHRYTDLGSRASTSGDMARFLAVAGVLVPGLSAGLGALVFLGPGPLSGAEITTFLVTWWSGDALGSLIVAPLVLVWVNPLRRREGLALPGELAAFLLAVGGATYGGFWLESAWGLTSLRLEFLLAPLLIWGSIRLGLFGAANGTLVAAVTAVSASLLGIGPYGSATPLDLAGLQGLLLVTAGTALMLGMVVTCKRVALEEAQQASRLREDLEELRNLIDQPEVGMMILDGEGAIRYSNQAAARLLKRGPQELVGEPLGVPLVAGRKTEIGITRSEGEPGEAEITVNPIHWGSHPLYLVTFHDVTERNRAERAIQYQAQHDGLTGLPNREHFQEQAERIIAATDPGSQGFALLFIDLDRFKEVNDTLGHPTGDELLRTIARRLRDGIREGDLAARMSGDEFTVLLDGIGDREAAYRVAEQLRQRLFTPVPVGEDTVTPSGTIGISLFPQDGTDFETLLRKADTAMYAAKESGRAQIRTFHADQGGHASRRFHLEQGLRRALVNDELSLLYQPLLRLPDRRLLGVEALLRWEDPEHGMVSPGDFIPLLEETGLIHEVGEWVFRQAQSDLALWQAQGLKVPTVWVNVAARQLEGRELQDRLDGLIEGEGLDPGRFGLELTESGVAGNMAHSRELLTTLKDRGFALAMDDFGTGYSALSFLQELPLDEVKIDRAFIRGLGEDPRADSMVRTIIAMAHGLGMVALAEGVETEAQAQWLAEEGCDAVQGFLFSHPKGPTHLAAFLSAIFAEDPEE